jgi:hypothetical protein
MILHTENHSNLTNSIVNYTVSTLFLLNSLFNGHFWAAYSQKTNAHLFPWDHASCLYKRAGKFSFVYFNFYFMKGKRRYQFFYINGSNQFSKFNMIIVSSTDSLPGNRTVLMFIEHQVEVEVNLRPTVSRPVCTGVRRPSGTRDHFVKKCFIAKEATQN